MTDTTEKPKRRSTRVAVDDTDAAPAGPDAQPVSTLEWVDPTTLHANDYNPNRVAPPELRLLKTSILEDGWTQPIVVRADGEIVDGFHRWTVAQDPDVAALTNGKVPVVRLRDVDAAHQRMSTVRHNRARGAHYVVRMADLVAQLIDEGLDDDTIGRRLQMEPEEVRRLRERGHMPSRAASDDGFGKAWVPKPTDHGGADG